MAAIWKMQNVWDWVPLDLVSQKFISAYANEIVNSTILIYCQARMSHIFKANAKAIHDPPLTTSKCIYEPQSHFKHRCKSSEQNLSRCNDTTSCILHHRQCIAIHSQNPRPFLGTAGCDDLPQVSPGFGGESMLMGSHMKNLL